VRGGCLGSRRPLEGLFLDGDLVNPLGAEREGCPTGPPREPHLTVHRQESQAAGRWDKAAWSHTTFWAKLRPILAASFDVEPALSSLSAGGNTPIESSSHPF